MTIDASIIGGLKPFQPETPFDNYGKMMSLQNLMQKSQLGEFDIKDHQQADDANNALSRLLSQNTAPADVAQGLAGQGYGKQAMAYLKTQQDQAKTRAETAHLNGQSDKLASENLNLAIGRHRDELSGVNTYDSAVDWVKRGYADPAMTSISSRGNLQQSLAQIPQDPEGFQNWKMQSSLSAENAMKYTTPDANATLNSQTLTGNNANTVRASMRGQDITAYTSRANNSDTIKKDLMINGMGPDGASTGDVESMAQGIASGKLAPINGFALARPRGQAIMARAMEINPNYDSGDYAAKNAAIKDFAIGKTGTALRAFNVASDHLDTLGQMADALHNGNMLVLNQIGNAFNKATGNSAPTNFDAVKAIVSKEVVKSIVAGGGGVSEREELEDLMDSANSPAQLKGVIIHFKDLMDAQKAGLLDQYERTTGRTDGETVFAPSHRSAVAAQQDGAVSKSKSGQDIVMRNGKWEYK